MDDKQTRTPLTILKDPEEVAAWVDEHGDVLYNYAYLRVREHGLAEDLVQDTFLAALKAFENFQGRSSVRTWLMWILKHKIVDYFRKKVKDRPLSVEDFHEDTLEKARELNGNWLAGAPLWFSDPGKNLEQKEFVEFFQQSLAQLPPKLSQVFILHALDGLPGSEICAALKISSSNLWVMLYRARNKLKKQLGHLLKEKGTRPRKAHPQKVLLSDQELSEVPIKG